MFRKPNRTQSSNCRVAQILIPAVCFGVCISFQAWEFAGKHNEVARARRLFEEVRAGWVTVRLSIDALEGSERPRRA